MLRTLEMMEFIIYVAPWMLFAFICLLGMFFHEMRADFTKNEIIKKNKEISYLKRRIQQLEGKEAIRTANNYNLFADKEAKK